MGLPVSFEPENGSVHLGFDGDLDFDVALNRCQAGQTVPLVVFPLGQLWVSWGIGRSLQDLTLHFPQVALPPQEALIWIPASMAA